MRRIIFLIWMEANITPAANIFAFLKKQVTPEGFIDNGLGDWGNPDHKYAKANVETCFFYADAVLLRNMARILGKEAEEPSSGCL